MVDSGSGSGPMAPATNPALTGVAPANSPWRFGDESNHDCYASDLHGNHYSMVIFGSLYVIIFSSLYLSRSSKSIGEPLGMVTFSSLYMMVINSLCMVLTYILVVC